MGIRIIMGYYEGYINSACKAWISRKHSIYVNYSQSPEKKELHVPINGSDAI